VTLSSDYWDAWAPHHSSVENDYLDLPSLRRIVHDIHQPVLVVGAGQGLIVAELRRNGFRSDGVDLSSEMIRYAKTRRGLKFVQADARAMPFGEGTYETIIYASGVVDFISDEEQIKVIMNEARRINQSGNIFVAFYRFSSASEDFLARLGLLRNNVLSCACPLG
jgi:2-polyprenyl-3-methyl-5-hydroxy-6-metoxy-1,4-benzoquinol methylase